MMYRVTLLACLGSLTLLLGCGANPAPATPKSSIPTPTSATPAPAPAPAPSPSPSPSPAPGSSASNAGVYQVQVVDFRNQNNTVGAVTVNSSSNNGDMTVQLTNAVPSTTLHVTFCRWATYWQDCFEVGTLTTSSSGSANQSMKFPKAGVWAGVFYLGSSAWSSLTAFQNGPVQYATESSAYTGNFGVGQNYRVALVPQNQVPGGSGWTSPTTSDPLASGFVSVNGQMLHAEVHGAKPDTTYQVSFCLTGGRNSSCNYYGSAGAFTTNAAGNGSVDVQVYAGPADVFFVDHPTEPGAGFMTAFKVQ